MLAVKIVCIGKLKEKYWKDAIAEYGKRLKPFCKFSLLELPEARLSDNPSAAQIEVGLENEAKEIKKHVEGKVFSLCIEGEMLSSEGLAAQMEACMLSPGTITFIIGSSFGLHSSIKNLGNRVSMSKMTFPHQLARVMLSEQIYRAVQIINNTKYHK